MAADLAARRNSRPVTVFFGVRAAADLFHLERLEAIRGRMPGLEIVPVLSEPGPGWAGETGLVTDAVDRRLPRLSGYDAHLCGPYRRRTTSGRGERSMMPGGTDSVLGPLSHSTGQPANCSSR